MTTATDGNIDDYRAIGEWYDAEHDPILEDVELFLQLAQIVGDPILEIGCGSGRILAPLAAAGYDVAGTDRSIPMLDRARRRLQGSTGTNPALICADMGELPAELTGRHGLVILSHNTLLHATTAADQRTVLSAAHAALDPRGMLVIDLFNPLADLSATEPGRVTLEGRWPTAEGESVTKFSSRSVNQADQRIQTDIWYDHVDQHGVIRRTSTMLELRFLPPQELLLMLELSGFVEPQLYGSYDLDPYVESSPRIIVTAEVTPS